MTKKEVAALKIAARTAKMATKTRTVVGRGGGVNYPAAVIPAFGRLKEAGPTAVASNSDPVVITEGSYGTNFWRLINGDSRVVVGGLAPGSVNCVVTSPPYYWQRDYGVDGQIGHEQKIAEYVAAIVRCFQDVKTALRDDGTVFLNLGDTYYSAKGKPHGTDKKNRGRQLARRVLRAVDGPGLGLPRKSLIGIPWRVALAMQADGWTLRSDVVWRRPATMPEPTARDRPWLTYEHVFIFSKSPRYWFDRSAVAGEEDVWRISAKPDLPGTHFAPFPVALAEKCIRCGCPPNGTVLDPFVGSGTSMVAALGLARNAIGVELSKAYCDFVVTRLKSFRAQAPLFAIGQD